MSTEQNNPLSSNNENYTKDEYLPPRSIKHGRRRAEVEEEETETEDLRPKNFPLLQILMWSLLSMILFMIMFGLWEHYQENVKQTANYAEETNKNNSQDMADDEYDLEEESKLGEEESKSDVSKSDDAGNHVEDVENDLQDDTTTVSKDPQETEVNNVDNELNPTPAEDGHPETNQPKVIKEHIVQPGETFYRITMKYYNSRAYEDYLADFNGIKDKTDIKAGTIIKIPEAR